jgi:hypothetical protein
MAVKVGDVIHGFANGYFGDQSYECRMVELVGPDYIVVRSSVGPEFLAGRHAINNLPKFMSDHDYCDKYCDGPSSVNYAD